MSDCTPLYEPGKAITVHADATIVGCRFVRVSAAKQPGSTLTAAGADDTSGGNVRVDQTFTPGQAVPAFGVADKDAAIGGKPGAYTIGGGFVVPVECSAAITAGTRVMPAADGRAAVYAAGAGPDIAASGGLALTTTTAAGQFVFVLLY